MNTEMIIQEKDLELVVREKTLGSLTTNAMQIRDMVKNALPMYDISNYNDDNIDQAKKDKATLNKAAKALNDRRLEIEKEFMKPFAEFKDVVTETVKLISECSGNIDSVVKQNEKRYKDKKKEEIQDYFESKNDFNVPFSRCFLENWLNKSFSIKVCFSEINRFFEKIASEMKTIESIPEDVDVLRTYYLDCLDLNNTIQYGNRLKEQRSKVEEERIKAEWERKQAEESGNPEKMECPGSPTDNPFSRINQQMAEQPPFVQHPKEEISVQTELLTRAFKVTATRDNIISLGDFMNEHGIYFEKIEV